MDSNRQYREDRGTLRKSARTDEGYLLVEGIAAKAGVYVYHRADGSTFRELVDADVLADSVATLARKPVTVGHPKRMVGPDTVGDESVGTVGERVIVDDGWVRVTATIQRQDGIAAAERKGHRELSCGYWADVDPTPGTWVDPDGVSHRYDQRQTGRVHNHLALVQRGRHGHEARLRIDSLEGAAVMAGADNTPPNGDPIMLKFRIDATQYQTDDATLVADVARVTQERDDAKALLDEALTETETAKGELAATKAKLDEAEAKLAERGDSDGNDAVQAKVDARLALLGVAAAAGCDVAEMQKLDDVGVKRAVVAKSMPKLDGVAEATGPELDGMFRAATASVSKADGLQKLATALAPSTDGKPPKRKDAAGELAAARGDFMANLGKAATT